MRFLAIRALYDRISYGISRIRRLRTARPAAEEPLRAELLSIEQLKRFAKVLARQHEINFGPGYNRLLPRLTQGPMKGLHRVYCMAFELISHLDGKLDVETTSAFVAAYLPSGSWNSFCLHYRFRQNFWHITVNKAQPDSGISVTLDGAEQSDGHIPLFEDGCDHQVTVLCGASAGDEKNSVCAWRTT